MRSGRKHGERQRLRGAGGLRASEDAGRPGDFTLTPWERYQAVELFGLASAAPSLMELPKERQESVARQFVRAASVTTILL